MASFHCRDLGFNCSYEVTGKTEQEIIRHYIDHAESAHNIQVLSADVIHRVKNAIKK